MSIHLLALQNAAKAVGAKDIKDLATNYRLNDKSEPLEGVTVSATRKKKNEQTTWLIIGGVLLALVIIYLIIKKKI